MAKPLTNPSDRGRNNPEPGDTPGTRAEQRGTSEQLGGVAVADDPAISWEREEQDRLPPRGEGSQHNQGEEKQAIVAEVPPEAAADDADVDRDGLQLGGTRGPSNQADNGSGR